MLIFWTFKKNEQFFGTLSYHVKHQNVIRLYTNFSIEMVGTFDIYF
jgi:hypothetical protein